MLRKIASTVFQFLSTFILLEVIYMIFAFLDSDFGFDGLIGLLIFQPILGAIISSITIGICFIVGLPIRKNNNLNIWWKKHIYIAIIGNILGFFLLVCSLLPQFTETVSIEIEESQTRKEIPNSILLYTGWFLAGFMTLHIYPPSLSRKPE